MVNLARLEQQLVLHEGIRLKIYQDTEGYDTIGVGYNVSSRGLEFLEKTIGRKINRALAGDLITKAEALLVLRADIERVQAATRVHFPEFDNLNEVRQRVCLDLAFNMGFKALGFQRAIAAVKAHDWSRAARELYKSRWANQVGDGEGGKFDRADRLGRMLLTGQDYTA